MDELKIEVATDQDIPLIDKLVHTCYRGQESFEGWTSEAAILGGCRTTPERLQREMNNPEIKILKGTNDQGELIACVLTQKRNLDEMFVGMLCVQPKRQNLGLGKKMMNAAEQLARKSGCKSLVVEVITKRTELVAWYNRLGFMANSKVKPFPAPTFEFGMPKVALELGEFQKSILPEQLLP